MGDKNLPAKRQANAGALATAGDYADFAGAGFDNQTADDISIPFLGILQALSPEVAGPKEQRLPGASVGMLINTVTKELIDGDKGLIFQPCDTHHVFVEWKPRNQGGGFVAVHPLDSAIVAQAKAESKKFGEYRVGQNDLIETYYIVGLVHRSEDIADQVTNPPEPMLIAFTSTKIKIYKNVMTRLRTVKGNPPLFAHRLRIRTVEETNANGTFANFVIQPLVENDVVKSLIPAKHEGELSPLLVMGNELLKAYRGGQMKANHDKQEGGTAGPKGDDIPF